MGFKDDNYATPTHRGHNPYLQEALNKLSDKEKETLEEAAEKHYEEQSREFENNTDNPIYNTSRYLVAGFIEGANYQAERMYSEEEVKVIVNKVRETGLTVEYLLLTEQFKKK